jgi:hypothetical protein
MEVDMPTADESLYSCRRFLTHTAGALSAAGIAFFVPARFAIGQTAKVLCAIQP